MALNKANIQFYANSEDITDTVFNRPLNQLIAEIENTYLELSGGTITGNLTVDGNVNTANITATTSASFPIVNVSSTISSIRGIKTATGTGDFRFGYNPTIDTLSFGYTGALKPVTGREDNPANNGFMVWDSDFNGARSYQSSNARDMLGLANTATITSTTVGEQLLVATTEAAARDAIELGATNDVTFRNLNVDDLFTSTSSDENLKKEIKTVDINWNLYDEIVFVTGLYNEHAKDSIEGTRFYGVIAQKVIKVFPWCCGKDEQDYLFVDYPKLALAIALAEKSYPLHRKLFAKPFNKLINKLFGDLC